jgi:hypothetical protein
MGKVCANGKSLRLRENFAPTRKFLLLARVGAKLQLTLGAKLAPSLSIKTALWSQSYNATCSLVRFGSKNILFYFEKHFSLHNTTLALQL